MEKEIYENDAYVVLKNEKGQDENFIDIAGISLSHGYYAILQPVNRPKGMAEDEAFVFRVDPLGDEDNAYTIVLDDAIVDEVFAEYGRLLDEAEDLGEQEKDDK